MKTFEVEIGGKVRRLAFHTRDALELKKRFGLSPRQILIERVMGLNTEGKFSAYLIDPEAQIFVLYLALRRGGSKLTEDALLDWIEEASKKDDYQFGDLIAPAAKCAFYSASITGEVVDLDAKPKDDDEGAAPGKGEAGPAETT